MNEVAVVGTARSLSESIDSYLAQVTDVLERLPTDAIERVISRLEETRWKRQQVFTCGNGGSATTAIHFASDLAKGALTTDKPPIRARSLCDNVALLTAWANDSSYDDVFTQQLAPWIRAGDVLLAMSGSGNSRNVLNAVEMARAAGATTIGFAGFNGGKLRHMADICVAVPSASIEQVEDIHLILCHLITRCLREVTPAREPAIPGGIEREAWRHAMKHHNGDGQ